MRKNLKGKDCGKGIYLRKDGLCRARFVDKTGKRHEKDFQTIPKAKKRIEEAKYADKHEDVFVATATMDRYVHVTTDSLDQAVRQLQQNGGYA